MSRRSLPVLALIAVFLLIPLAPARSLDWNTTTFDSYFTPGTNPCDGSAVPERTGTTTLAVAERVRPSGHTHVYVRVELEIAAGEYVTRMLNSAEFDQVASAYTFPAKSVTYRNGVPEYVSFATQTVFMSGDQPVAHSVYGGPGSVCLAPSR